MDYLDFELRISMGSEGAYPIAVIRSPAGEASATMRLPDDPAFKSRLRGGNVPADRRSRHAEWMLRSTMLSEGRP